ncbi:MAG: M23 family metallopeptidase [Acidimicrobiia bacterium]|nr:M23 family metallopeptidase [Acidimicrobiia bacterium]
MRTRWRAAGIVVLSTIALGAGAFWQARAQLVGPPPSTTAPPQTSAPTTQPPTTLLHPPPTTAPKPPPTQPPSTQPPKPPTPPTTAPTTTTTTVNPNSQTIPPDAQAEINAVKRTPPNSTAGLLQALSALQAFGLTPQEAINVGFGHFPVAGMANWSDDWLMPRFTPTFHLHQGNDIFAAGGTPIRATFDGTVTFSQEPVGGNDVYLHQSNGTFFFCAHAASFAPGITSGQTVKQGTIVGFVGNTGDAQGGATHCHFEVHPNCGPAVDPKPTLDGWINEDLANVPNLIAAYETNVPKAVAAAGFIRRFDVGDQGMFSAPGRPAAGPLLWASSVNPPGGTLQLAQAEVAQAAGEMDWDQILATQEEKALEDQQAQGAVIGIMQPLMPKALSALYPAPSLGF